MLSPSLVTRSTTSQAGKTAVVRGVIHGLLHRRWSGGERLTESAAAELFAVSRTPVREALLELAAMGVVELRRNCGAILQPFGARELSELYDVRMLLEVEATRLAAPRIPHGTVLGLQKTFQQLRTKDSPDPNWIHDRRLHAAIAESSGNLRLNAEIKRHGDLVQTIRESVGRVFSVLQSSSREEHLRILERLLQRDVEGAAEAMRLHLTQAKKSALRMISTVGDSAL